MDGEVAKQMQRLLGKQGLKFKLNTKVTSGKLDGDTVKVEVEDVKKGSTESVS